MVPHPKDTSQPVELTKLKTNPEIPAPKHYKVIHIASRHDTFKTLERKYGVDESAIRAWNHLGTEHPLHPGQELLIWRASTARNYAVKSGDSLSRIAIKHQLTMNKLLALNPGIDKDKIRVGQTINI